MKILFLSTKPPWPAVDGGRLLVRATLEGLAARGNQITLVAPVTVQRGAQLGEVEAALVDCCVPRLVAARPRSPLLSLLRSQLSRRPLSIERHALAEVRSEVARLLATQDFDAVHVEQLQALGQAGPAFLRSVPVVLRAENVETDLWAGTARFRSGVRPLARWEARRMAAWEGRAVLRVAAAVALSRRDAERLEELAAHGRRVEVVRAPFAPQLPAASQTLAGSPPVVLLGSAGWLPNEDAARWFIRSVWPVVRAALPLARLHVFGNRARRLAGQGVDGHPLLTDSQEAFAPGSVLVVPLRIASGVRIRVLEAWARGVPVVATPEAAAGLEAEDGRELLLARDPSEFAAALRRLAEQPELVQRLVAAGREALTRRHDPATAAAQLEEIYLAAIQGGGI